MILFKILYICSSYRSQHIPALDTGTHRRRICFYFIYIDSSWNPAIFRYILGHIRCMDSDVRNALSVRQKLHNIFDV